MRRVDKAAGFKDAPGSEAAAAGKGRGVRLAKRALGLALHLEDIGAFRALKALKGERA